MQNLCVALDLNMEVLVKIINVIIAYQPETNGLKEHFNKILADMLSMHLDV